MEQSDKSYSRRKFLGNTAVLGALGAVGVSQVLKSCGGESKPANIDMPVLLDAAPDGEPIRLGVVGCGGRGTGATMNFLDAGPNLSVVAVADAFQDRVDNFRTKLKETKSIELEDKNCFVGLDAYKRLLETDVNYVILATPPYFRPEHFEACVEARKHVFMEKPVAVDPVGARSVMASSKQAEAAGISVVTGTQRRHSRDYLDTWKQVQMGSIGDIVSTNVYWLGRVPWYRKAKPGWSEMEAMLRDWVNWTWLSGDHIVEQHIHNIDVSNWFVGKAPVSAVGMGSRARRITGDSYDNFSVDYIYDNEVHMNSMCRQISDCHTRVNENIRGTKGYTNAANTIWNPDGTEKYKFAYETDTEGKKNSLKVPGMVQEHINLITAIRTGNQIVTAEETAKSTLTAIMGRISTYTGKEVTWEEMMGSDMKIGPEKIEMGPVDYKAVIPLPGSDQANMK